MTSRICKHALTQRGKYARWLDADDPAIIANAMHLIIGRALNMLKSQIAAQGKAFAESGGFSERLMAKRLEARESQRSTEHAPACPQCQHPMRRRRFAKGEFWGRTTYPACKGTIPI